ncbi:13939_t:CDS:1, partial [Funneliformis caledonium]
SEFDEHSFSLMNLKEDLKCNNKSYSEYKKVSEGSYKIYNEYKELKEDLKFDNKYENLINAESNNYYEFLNQKNNDDELDHNAFANAKKFIQQDI